MSLGWKADDDHFLYAFVATGFRPGGLNVPVGLGLPAPFEPEEVTSFEAGWKANFAKGKIRTTVNGFYNDYHNFQVIIGYPTFPTFGIELNVEDATKIYGYLTIPEDAKIGVCAHELGHLLFGFPDLYDTDDTSEGIGNWCLMAGGSWNGGGDVPAHPSAWCKANHRAAFMAANLSCEMESSDKVKALQD